MLIIPEGVYLSVIRHHGSIGGTAIFTVMWADSMVYRGAQRLTAIMKGHRTVCPTRCMVDTKTENVYRRVAAPRNPSPRSRSVSRILTLAEETTPNSDGATMKCNSKKQQCIFTAASQIYKQRILKKQ